ncbi:Bis(5'-nucleosyl)-tetraphosphatase, symmetrical [compost metagenome]
MIELDPSRGYDLIGDVHGCAHTLDRLLETLGYRLRGDVWRHPRRQALFLGDIVDRGPRIREALHRVYAMVAAGEALCIMGNHEFDALGWSTPAPPGSGRTYVREHTPRHERLIHETLEQFEGHPADWRDFLGWFQTLPLFLDAGRFRMVHACWDRDLIEILRRQFPDGCIDQAFVKASAESGSFAHRVCNRLLRGTDMRLPNGLTLTGSDGYTRAFFRTKFWEEDREPETYGDIVFQPDGLPADVAREPLSLEQKSRLLAYGADEPLLFVGHYWRSGTPAPIRPNLACLDYSAVKYGKLVAYRLDDETRLERGKFVWVDVKRPGVEE